MVFNPPIVKKGKLVTSGSSVVITIPPEWLEEHELKAGDDIMIISNGELRVLKMDEENVKKVRNQLANSQSDTLNPDSSGDS